MLAVPAAPLFTGGHGLDLGVTLTGTQALKQEAHIVPGTSRVQLAPRRLESLSALRFSSFTRPDCCGQEHPLWLAQTGLPSGYVFSVIRRGDSQLGAFPCLDKSLAS